MSTFFGIGKVAALKIVRTNINKSFQSLFQEIGIRWELSDELLVKLQEFKCRMYTCSLGASDVSKLRYRYGTISSAAFVF